MVFLLSTGTGVFRRVAGALPGYKPLFKPDHSWRSIDILRLSTTDQLKIKSTPRNYNRPSSYNIDKYKPVTLPLEVQNTISFLLLSNNVGDHFHQLNWNNIFKVSSQHNTWFQLFRWRTSGSKFVADCVFREQNCLGQIIWSTTLREHDYQRLQTLFFGVEIMNWKSCKLEAKLGISSPFFHLSWAWRRGFVNCEY